MYWNMNRRSYVLMLKEPREYNFWCITIWRKTQKTIKLYVNCSLIVNSDYRDIHVMT